MSSIFGSIINAGVNAAGIASQNKIANQNLQFQQQNLDYQKALQERIFRREDNAVQRRAEDLEAAGLSKTLAAGSAANAGTPIQTTAPQMSEGAAKSMAKFNTDISIADSVLNLMQKGQDIAKTRAEAEIMSTRSDFMKHSPFDFTNDSWIAQLYRAFNHYGIPVDDLLKSGVDYVKKFFKGFDSGHSMSVGKTDDGGSYSVPSRPELNLLGSSFDVPSKVNPVIADNYLDTSVTSFIDDLFGRFNGDTKKVARYLDYVMSHTPYQQGGNICVEDMEEEEITEL